MPPGLSLLCMCVSVGQEPEQLMQFLHGMHSFGTLFSPVVVSAFDLR